jgi:hypothetical protein
MRHVAISAFALWMLVGCGANEKGTTVLKILDRTDAIDPDSSSDDPSNPDQPSDSDPDDPPIDETTVGAEWGSGDLSCVTTADCDEGEVCISDVCQVDRCSAADYDSIAPLGEEFIFYADREFAVTDGDDYHGTYYADLYGTESRDAEYTTSYESGAGRMLDIAGGDFLGNGTETYAAAIEFDSGAVLHLLDGSTTVEFTTSFMPLAIDAGDIDGDGRAELVIIGEDTAKICDFVDDDCETWSPEDGAELIDVAVADIDGDSIPEIITLQKNDDDWRLWVDNRDWEHTGQNETYQSMLPIDAPERIAAGDVLGEGAAQVVVLDDRGGWALRHDDIYTYSFDIDSGEFVEEIHQSMDYRGLVDLDVGDLDADGIAELVLLDSGEKVMTFRYASRGFELDLEQDLGETGNPKTIALADHDGDSPRAVLTGEVEVVSGAQVPIVLLYLPPYSEEYSNGYSYNGYGMGETFSETFTDTVSLSLNADLGTSVEFFSLFKAKFSQQVSWKTSQTLGETRSISTGGRSTMRSDPGNFGHHYGAVVVSWGCFHAYTYEIVDENDRYAGADGEPLVITVPVDGGTAMLSTTRYNSMAEQIGGLPEMPVPYTVGDLSTYPAIPETIYGEPIPDSAYVFPDLQWYEVSDVGYVGWFNQVGETTTNSETHGMDIGASASVTVSGVTIGTGVTAGWGSGYSLTLGETALFNGGIPPFVDDPATHEDEYVENFYRVAPIVYRQEYTDDEGNTSGFYVATYAIDM